MPCPIQLNLGEDEMLLVHRICSKSRKTNCDRLFFVMGQHYGQMRITWPKIRR